MIGVGIVTYDREKEFTETYDSIQNSIIDVQHHIKDGGKPVYTNINRFSDLWCLEENKGVGFCKNLIIEELLNKGCDHLFILEDDLLVKDNTVWEYCIDFAEHTGLMHFNWNNYRDHDKKHTLAQFPNHDALISINTEANFSYFNKKFLEEIRFDNKFFNAWEHVDVEYQGVLKGFLPAFRMFVSPAHLEKYLSINDNGKSTIAHRPLHQERIIQGYNYWIEKWGKSVNSITPIEMEEFVFNMKRITEKYAKR